MTTDINLEARHELIVSAVMPNRTGKGVVAIALCLGDGKNYWMQKEVCAKYGIAPRDIGRRRFSAYVLPADPDHPKHAPERGGIVRLVTEELTPLPHPVAKKSDDEFDAWVGELEEMARKIVRAATAPYLREKLRPMLGAEGQAALDALVDRAHELEQLLEDD